MYCECASPCAQAAELLKVPLQGLLPTPSDELQRHAELATGSLYVLFERCARLHGLLRRCGSDGFSLQ